MPITQKQFETSFALSTKSLKLARALHILTRLRCQSIALHIKDVQTSTLFIFQGSVLCQPSYWQGTRKRAERYLIFKAALFPLRIVVNYVFEKYVPWIHLLFLQSSIEIFFIQFISIMIMMQKHACIILYIELLWKYQILCSTEMHVKWCFFFLHFYFLISNFKVIFLQYVLLNVAWSYMYSGLTVSSYFQQYATTFPLISVDDMVRANFLLLDELGINKVNTLFLSISFSSSHIYILVKVKNTYILWVYNI